MATVARAGLARGSTIFHQIPGSLQPSMRAASSRLFGTVMKNCRMRKILKAPPPRNIGTVRGLKVLSQPSSLKMTKTGIMVTCIGSIIVAMTR